MAVILHDAYFENNNTFACVGLALRMGFSVFQHLSSFESVRTLSNSVCWSGIDWHCQLTPFVRA